MSKDPAEGEALPSQQTADSGTQWAGRALWAIPLALETCPLIWPGADCRNVAPYDFAPKTAVHLTSRLHNDPAVVPASWNTGQATPARSRGDVPGLAGRQLAGKQSFLSACLKELRTIQFFLPCLKSSLSSHPLCSGPCRITRASPAGH